VSAHKRIVLLATGGTVLLAAAILSWLSVLHQTQDLNTATLSSGGKRYSLSIAATPQMQQRGLGEQQSLPQNQGMLFIFDQPATQCFWMKDMRFPLDMIWVSTARRVEHIKANVSPRTYPNTFCPAVQAKYVIELNAGQAKLSGMHTGQTLSF
jgi:uncharacterized membrane protein (UPF0127 family)